MPNPFDPGAIWDPGTAAGYVYGTNAMRLVCVHKTAGNDSYGIVKNGHLAQWLIPYEGKRWQFAEADAICWDSPPNQDGPGFEIEAPVLVYGGVRQDLSTFRPMSDSQINETGELIHWLHDEWGVPLELWDGGWVPAGPPGYHGFANHGDIDPPRQRSDGMTRAEWDACLGLVGDDVLNDADKAWIQQTIAVAAQQAVGTVLDTLIGDDHSKKATLVQWLQDNENNTVNRTVAALKP